MCADVRFECDCIPFPFCLFTTVSQCVCPCERVHGCLHLPSLHCTHKMNHLPHKSKELTEPFFFFCMAKRLHNMIECAVYTSARIHTNLVADGGRRHTCTHHTLTVSFLLTQTHFEPVQTDGARTDVHMHALSGDTTPTLVGKLDPRCPEAERQKDRRRDQWTQWCVCYLHPNSQFSLSLTLFLIFLVFIFLFPNSKLQIQHSVSSARSLVNSHTNILSIFICFILHLTQRLHPVHVALTFFFFFPPFF